MTLPYASSHADNGKILYEKYCTGCHGTEVFTRPDRSVTNRSILSDRVRRCSYALETKWFDSEINAVSDYLNSNFYKFR